MNTAKYIFLLLLFITFSVGFVVLLSKHETEAFQDFMTPETRKEIESSETCPDLLISTSNGIVLVNTRQQKELIRFSNLDEYIQYVEVQRENGIHCPVLFLQQENDTQGKDVYRIRPSPFSMDGGVPTVQPVIDASRENPPYNQDMYAGFDPQGQSIGKYTTLDKIHDSTKKTSLSDNPMDTNWGGVTFSQESVLSGKYADNEVGKPTMVPKVIPKQ